MLSLVMRLTSFKSVQTLFPAEDVEQEVSAPEMPSNIAGKAEPEDSGATRSDVSTVSHTTGEAIFYSRSTSQGSWGESPERPQSAMTMPTSENVIARPRATKHQPRWPRQEQVGAVCLAPRPLIRRKPRPTAADLRPRNLRELTHEGEHAQMQMEREATLYIDGFSDKRA